MIVTLWPGFASAVLPFPWTGTDPERGIDEVAAMVVSGDPGHRTGFALAAVDWDGDGAQDLVVAEPWADVHVPGEGLRYAAGRIGIFLAPFTYRDGSGPLLSPLAVHLEDADVVLRGPPGGRLGYRLLVRPAGDSGPALAASVPGVTGARFPGDANDRPIRYHAGEVWLLDGGEGLSGSHDAQDAVWNRGRLRWEGVAEGPDAWVPNDLGYELARIDDMDGDGLPELAVAVPSVVVLRGEDGLAIEPGGTLIVPGSRVMAGGTQSASEGWWLTGAVGQQDPVFTGPTFAPARPGRDGDGLAVGELLHHRGAGALYLLTRDQISRPPGSLDVGPRGLPTTVGLSASIPLDGGFTTVIGEGSAVGGEFAFGSALAQVPGAPGLAAAALQSQGEDEPPRATTLLLPWREVAELGGPLAETDDLDPWRIVGDEHPDVDWRSETALEGAMDDIASLLEAMAFPWAIELFFCSWSWVPSEDHQCQQDFAAHFRYATTAMDLHPRSAHLPAGWGPGLVIGEPLFDGDAGAVHAILPDWTSPPTGPLALAPPSAPPPGWTVARLSGQPDGWLGHTLIAPGDLDGDGVDDLVVGAPGLPRGREGTDPVVGRAYLLLSAFHADHDDDGVTVAEGDCDDHDVTTWPGAVEACDGVDNDCDGQVPPDEIDGDQDGSSTCAGDCDDADPVLTTLDLDGDGWSPCDGDCDDGDPALSPEDQDGDGWSTCGTDGKVDCDDGDGERDPEDRDGDGWSTCDGDCVDQPSFVHADGRTTDGAAIHPDADELADGWDNDCDDVIDEGVVSCAGCGWTDAGRTVAAVRSGPVLALLVSLSVRQRRAGRRRSRP